MTARTLSTTREAWPIAGHFSISRGSRTHAEVIRTEISSGGRTGQGECVPYARYGESLDSVSAQIESARALVETGASRADLASVLPAGAARNALDCALLDLEAKTAGQTAAALLGLAVPAPAVTAYTISLDTPNAMGEAAAKAAHYALLKVKLGGAGDGSEDEARIAAVRAGAPGSRLIVDANEAWAPGDLARLARACADAGVELIEQPIAADADAALDGFVSPVPLCADESCHDRASLAHLSPAYRAINIKLDKTGGLTEAVALAREAEARGLDIMIGCMVGTSLAMAPATLLMGFAAYVDLDGPLLLAEDRSPALKFKDAQIFPTTPDLWG